MLFDVGFKRKKLSLAHATCTLAVGRAYGKNQREKPEQIITIAGHVNVNSLGFTTLAA